jgi:hypothetical protein
MATMMKTADELTMEVAMVVMIMIVMTVKEVGVRRGLEANSGVIKIIEPHGRS